MRQNINKLIKSEDKYKFILTLVLALLPFILIGVYFLGENNGYEKGGEAGFNIAIDTLNKILDTKIDSNDVNKITTVFKSDTNVYYISNKVLTK